MINIYAFSYPAAIKEFANDSFILLKLGDSHRDTETRIGEQGASAEWQKKVIIGSWNNLQVIQRDHDLHQVLTKRGLWHSGDHKGTEWFKIPGKNTAQAYQYIDDLITSFEGKKVRKKVQLRKLQQQSLDKAIQYIDSSQEQASIIANLCPRFGKTIWSLALFNEVHKKYGNRVMLLPAYWLSVHTSFVSELQEYDDFLDIVQIDVNYQDAKQKMQDALDAGQRVIIPISLHGDLEDWKIKHQWIAEIPNQDIFSFADEGDFGTHTENQVSKLKFIFDTNNNISLGRKLVQVYASGTNIQRLSKCSKKIDGVIYTAYSQMEHTEQRMVKRKFYRTHVEELKAEVEALNERVQPSWTKIWAAPLNNIAFISKLFSNLVGEDTLRTELNLTGITGEIIECFLVLVSANNKQMAQISNIAQRAIPDWHIMTLNGDNTTNRDAEFETTRILNESKNAGKKGVIIIANQMGSRSYSIPEIQSTVIAYDRGSVDATTQKVSRCLTPGKTYAGSEKTYGHIVELSFDANRSENIERLFIDEAVQVQRSQNTDFTTAVKFVLSSIDMFKINGYGCIEEVTEDEMFKILGDNETLLKVADIAVDTQAALESGIFDILTNVNASGKQGSNKKPVIGENAVNFAKQGGSDKKKESTDAQKRNIEKIINDAIRALNMSATSVFYLADGGDSYRECLELIKNCPVVSSEFEELFGISASDAIRLVTNGVLSSHILDVIVQNSKHVDSPFN